ncbi:25757_t:CDS:2 [Gigaspora margarita]|uniref:25757_t:CDS:1 n=1 Tax=Gigaspora margarita TaxID=4874 RepID=A0ABN7V186_GIGMA|nr:25757_t:CDS:2 [Gigaspora margarita]
MPYRSCTSPKYSMITTDASVHKTKKDKETTSQKSHRKWFNPYDNGQEIWNETEIYAVGEKRYNPTLAIVIEKKNPNSTSRDLKKLTRGRDRENKLPLSNLEEEPDLIEEEKMLDEIEVYHTVESAAEEIGLYDNL